MNIVAANIWQTLSSITYKDIVLAVGGAFLGCVGGVIIALLLEWLKRPKFKFSIAAHSDQNPGNTPARFLHVNITNASLPQWIRWVLTRESALSCYAQIEFFRMDGSNAFARRMDVRWTGSPQPPQFIHNGVLHASDIDILRYRDLHTNRSEAIDIAVKFGNDANCYGFTNTSYLHGLRHPDWQLSPERYRVQISVYAGSYTATKSFILRNDWPRLDFCLEEE